MSSLSNTNLSSLVERGNPARAQPPVLPGTLWRRILAALRNALLHEGGVLEDERFQPATKIK